MEHIAGMVIELIEEQMVEINKRSGVKMEVKDGVHCMNMWYTCTCRQNVRRY